MKFICSANPSWGPVACLIPDCTLKTQRWGKWICSEPRDYKPARIAGRLALQWLGAGLGFPARDGAGSWWWKLQILATRPGAGDKGPGPSVVQKRIFTKMESDETVKYLFGGGKCTVFADRRTGSLRERVSGSCPGGSLNYFYGAFLPVFLWPVILICLVRSPYLVTLRTVPYVCTHLLVKMDFTEKASR